MGFKRKLVLVQRLPITRLKEENNTVDTFTYCENASNNGIVKKELLDGFTLKFSSSLYYHGCQMFLNTDEGNCEILLVKKKEKRIRLNVKGRQKGKLSPCDLLMWFITLTLGTTGVYLLHKRLFSLISGDVRFTKSIMNGF